MAVWHRVGMVLCFAFHVASNPLALTTEEPAEPADPLPFITVRTFGSIRHETNDTMTPQCAGAYATEMGNKANAQATYIDQRLGTEMCSTITVGEMAKETVTVSSMLKGTEMDFEFYNVYVIQSDITYVEVQNCATEIGVFLSDHGNWPQPILPPQGGCDPVVFDPPEFLHLFNNWYCDGPSAFSDKTKNILKYSIRISDELDQEAQLNADCVNGYTIEGTKKTNLVSGVANDWLLINCEGDIAIVDSYSSLLVSLPDSVYFEPLFEITWTNPDATFGEFVTCMDGLSGYLRAYTTWGDGIIPTPTGCPELNTKNSEFALQDKGLYCVDK